MQARPPTITIVAGLFLAVGLVGIGRPFAEDALHRPFRSDDLWVLLLSLAAILCGVSLLQRQNWARWLAVAWIAVHVAISFLNSIQEVLMHARFLLVIAYSIFRADANAWFRNPGADNI